MISIIKKVLIISIKVITSPLLLIMALIDANIANRIQNKRFGIRDLLPHIFVVAIAGILLLGQKNRIIIFDLDKINAMLYALLEFQGMIFATSLVITTFILTTFRPNKLKNKRNDLSDKIDDIVDDLRIANRIVFIALLVMLIFWFCVTSGFIINNGTLTTIVLSIFIWSLIAVYSIFRAVFYLVYLG